MCCCECSICEKEIASCSSDKNPLFQYEQSKDSPQENNPFKDYSVLMGNGIILSHPEVGNSFKFQYSEIEKKLIDSYKSHYSKYNPNCPEEFLNTIRIESSIKILNWYMKKFDDFSDHFNKENLTRLVEFVKPFQNIFTLNYDPIAYQAILDLLHPKSEFYDGLGRKESAFPVEEKNGIRTRIGENKGIYFLHGAFHIIHKDGGFYQKLQIQNGSLGNTLNKHKEIAEDYRSPPLLGQRSSDSNDDIFCVIDSSSMNKRAWIEEDPYLSFCLESLRKKGKVITLGCTFSKDDHILEALLTEDPVTNKSLEKLKIGVYRESDRENVYKALERIKASPRNKDKKKMLETASQKISFFCTKNLGDSLWEKEE